MSNKPTLSFGSKVSPETQAKIEKVKQAIAQPKLTEGTSQNTEDSTSKSKQLSPKAKQAQDKARYAAIFKKLIQQYPKCFSASPRPLAIGIHKAIWEQEEKKPEEARISKADIRHFLIGYTRSKAYREAMIAGGNRIDLQGNEIEKVSAQHMEIAKKSLEDWKNKQAAWKQNNKQKPHK